MKRIKLIFLAAILFTATTVAQNKYAISMFHFNFQYVAGDYKIETRIIRESLYPALQFFEKNPNLKANFEFQGYAIESMAEDFPHVLTLLKKLINRGQIELVIAHYSDQFYIAYPALDLKKSIEISDRILDKYGMKRSRVFFSQEIQYSPALASALKGKYDVMVTSFDPYRYYLGESQPLVNVEYGEDSMLAIIGIGEKKHKNLEWEWAFLDDGEVFNTLDYRSDFYFVPEQEKKHIDKYRELEKKGFKFVTMSEFVKIFQNDPDYKIEKSPYVPEGTWNMDICGPFMWMGRQRSGVETDGITRALSYEVRGKVLAAEALIKKAKAKGQNTTELEKMLDDAWIHLLLSEVSDSSGWTPWLVEVQYTENEVSKVEMLLTKIFKGLKGNVLADGKTLFVNTGTHEVKEVSDIQNIKIEDDYLPIPLAVRAKSYSTEVQKIQDGVYCLDIEAMRPKDGAVEITFNTASNGLWYSAGAGEEIAVKIPTDLKQDPAFTLSNGFINLGNGYNLIKDCSVEHIAATWKQKEKKLVFRQELNPKNPKMNMRFYIVKGDKDVGLKFGNALNTWPSYYITMENDEVIFKQYIPVI